MKSSPCQARMKLLLDQGLPRSTAEHLRQTGLDALHTGEIGMSTAADENIIAKAASEGRVVVTLDADFHANLALSGAAGPSVIRIRIEGVKAPECARLIQSVLARCEEKLSEGCMISVEEDRIRVRKLPLLQSGNM